MKLGQKVAALASFLLLFAGLAVSSPANAQPAGGGSESGPSKWFHHEKKNPNRNKVHHAKPAHRAKKQKSHSHHH